MKVPNLHQAKDNEALSVEEFRSCAEDLELDEWQIGEVVKMIERTVGHKTEVSFEQGVWGGHD